MTSVNLIALTLVLHLMSPGISAGQAPATAGVLGCITDSRGQPLPGVPVDVFGNGKHRIVRSNSAGCYEAGDLMPGSYVVFATLPGFLSYTRDQLILEPDRPEQVNFQMRVAAICECIGLPTTLVALWEEADAVVRLRISGHQPGPMWSSQHTATVLAVWKRDATLGPISNTLIFNQNHQRDETEPYAIGQDFIIFLRWVAEERVFARMSGDGTTAAFAIEDGRIRSAPIESYVGMDVGRFLNELESLSRR
jgi:hypothetical protein